MTTPPWRNRSISDPDVDRVTTAVGKLLARARRPGGWLHKLIAQHVQAGELLQGPHGVGIAANIEKACETQLEHLLRDTDGLLIFAGLRRLSRRLWVQDARSPTEHVSRLTAQLALYRYASWRGLVTDPDARAFRWERPDVDILGRVLLLAETFAEALNWRRRMCKGQTLRIEDEISMQAVPAEHDDERLQRLIEMRDQRVAAERSPLSVFGFYGHVTELDGPARIIAGAWRPLDEAHYILDVVEVGNGIYLPAHDLVADWGWEAGIAETLSALDYLDEAVWRTHGCRLADCVAVLHELSQHVIVRQNADPFVGNGSFAMAMHALNGRVIRSGGTYPGERVLSGCRAQTRSH